MGFALLLFIKVKKNYCICEFYGKINPRIDKL